MMEAVSAGVPEGPAVLPVPPPELKSQFRTREGSYRLLGPEPRTRAGPAAAPGPSPPAAASPGPVPVPPVRLSLVRLTLPPAEEEPGGPSERSRLCFNLGRELYFYGGTGAGGRGSRRGLDLQHPLDKRIYKGTSPTCHDFNQFTAGTETIALLVGFCAGQVQRLDLVQKESSKVFNQERLIDATKVTFIKWLPATSRLFLASHASGHLYLYDSEQPCGTSPPQYHLLRRGEGFSVFASKGKNPRNPLLKWAVGKGALNQFAFSPDGRSLACVSQDGVLRVFHFASKDLQGMFRSYFGGLLCVCWSPDGRYVVTGGEDDLVTVWSFAEGRVVARGHGHKSWVSAVAFDPFSTAGGKEEEEEEEEEEDPPKPPLPLTYRFGSAGQDTQFCLWDLSEDIIAPRPSPRGHRTLPGDPSPGTPPSAIPHPPGTPPPLPGVPPLPPSLSNSLPQGGGKRGNPPHPETTPTPCFPTWSLREEGKGGEREHKGYHRAKNNEGRSQGESWGALETGKVLGTSLCPRMQEVPLLEPLVCKKISRERLSVVLFLEECILTACQEGLVCTWERPGREGGGSPSGTVV